MSGLYDQYFHTAKFDQKNTVAEKNADRVEKMQVTLDLTGCREVRIAVGEHFVSTTPEHFIECVSWLLTNVDTETLVTKNGIEPER